MKAALILNGDAPSKQEMALLDDVNEVICADGAARHMLAAGLVPTVIVGDLDSLESDVYKWADAMSVPLERHPKAKDYTDGELALQRAMKGEPENLLILGGHGGRSSMFMANLKILRAAHDAGIACAMIGNGETIMYRSAGQSFDLAPFPGITFNVLPVGGDAEVSIEGASFEGENIVLKGTSARGVSNVVNPEGAAGVQVHSGIALVILEEHPDD